MATEEKHIPRMETRFDDMAGAASINFRDDLDFEKFAEEVAGIDPEKYKPVALRIFFHHEIVITIYALVKAGSESHRAQTGKVPVRKFKAEISPVKLIPYIKQADCTLVSGDYDVEDFDVVN